MAKSRSTARTRVPGGLRERLTVIIATEGARTEPDYFIYLQRKFRETNIDIVPRDYSRSDPMQVLDDMIEYKGQKSPRRSNVKAHWIVIDNDGRPPDDMRKVIARATENDLFVADSNPCFELWLLLHRKPLSDYDDSEIEELKRNEKIGNRSRLEMELVKVCGEYNKSNIREKDFLRYVTTAINNAQKTDTKPKVPWMCQIGTRVYRLALLIREGDSSPHNPRN